MSAAMPAQHKRAEERAHVTEGRIARQAQSFDGQMDRLWLCRAQGQPGCVRKTSVSLKNLLAHPARFCIVAFSDFALSQLKQHGS